VHDLLASGSSVKDAADVAVALIRGRGDIGVIVISAQALVAIADRPMAWAGRESGSSAWLGHSSPHQPG
jgi:hypothetical protein